MFYLGDLSNYKLNNVVAGLLKVDKVPGLKHIKVNSYIREGRIVRSSVRGLKPGKRLKLGTIKQRRELLNNKVLKPTRSKPAKIFNYLDSEFNKRFNYIAKEELNTWNNIVNTIKPKTTKQMTEIDDVKSIVNYIQEETRKNPAKFRSVSVGNKIGAMATVSKDIKNKALYVENLVANPNKFNNAEQYGGAGTTMLLHLIEESIEAGYGGKLTLSSLPGAVKFYRKLGFTSVGNPLNFRFELSSIAAQKLIEENTRLFNSIKSTAEFSTNTIAQAMDLEDIIVGFAIKRY